MSATESTTRSTNATFTVSSFTSIFKGIAPLPQLGVPELPAGLEVSTAAVRLVYGPVPTEVHLIPSAAEALKAHEALYRRALGDLAPPHDQVVLLLSLVDGWMRQGRLARTFGRFADVQMKEAWALFQTHLEAIRPALEVAAKRDATIATALKPLLDLGRARSQQAKRAAATRRANKNGRAEKKAADRVEKKRAQQHDLEAMAAKARALADVMEAEAKAEAAQVASSSTT